MKKSNSFTFDLIKTLTSSEKAYIKKQISTSNLSQNKSYLGKKIIEELISYRSKSVFEIDIHHQINEALILIEKKFYKRAKRIIDQCTKKALSIEDYATSYILVNIIFNGIDNTIYFGLSNEEIDKYQIDRSFYLSQLNRIDKLVQLNRIYFNIPIMEQVEAYTSKFSELNLLNETDLPLHYPLSAKRMFYFSKAHLAWISKKKDEYVFFNKKILNLFTKNERFVQLYFVQFLGDMSNFLASLIRVRDFDTFFEEHKTIESLIKTHEKNSHNIDNSLIYNINYYLLQLAYNYGRQFENSIQSSQELLKFLTKDKNQLSTFFKAISYIQIALAYFYNNKFKLALEYINYALNENNYNVQYLARLIQIITHHQLKNDLLLDHLFQSFYNYLKSADKKEQIPNIRKLRKHTKNHTVHLLKNEDFEDFVYIHWDLFEQTKK